MNRHPISRSRNNHSVYLTANTAFGIQYRNDNGVMWRGEINNTNHTASIYHSHLTTNAIRFSFVKCNIVISMSDTVIYHASLEYIISCQCFLLKLFYTTAVFRRFNQSFTDTLQLQFQFHIFCTNSSLIVFR